MSDSAEVRSLAQLQNLQERVAFCRVQTLKETDTLQVEVQKLTRWIEEEAILYWQQQLVQAERLLNEARDALMRCEAVVRSDEKRPCTDERKRLEKTKARRALCDQKLRAAREARLVWQKQVVKLRGRSQSVADLADADLQTTALKLIDIITTLKAYSQQ